MKAACSKIVDTLTCYEEIAEDYDPWEQFKTVAQAEEKVLLGLVSDVKAKQILDPPMSTSSAGLISSDCGFLALLLYSCLLFQ